jgi:hypothetical protein
MSSKLLLGRFIICCLSFTLPAFAQLDSSALRAKFGSPFNRETFHMPSGFDLIVDYGVSHQVCKLKLPALMPTNEEVRRASEMRRRMHEFLEELVPGSMRGRELGQITSFMSLTSQTSVEYEHVTIIELKHADRPFNDTITVSFKNDNCQDLTGQ